MSNENFGFIRIGCITPHIKKANTFENTKAIIEAIKEAESKNVGILLLPELAITGDDLGNLFTQKQLIKSQEQCLFEIAEATVGMAVTVILGYYETINNSLVHAMAIIQDGEIITSIEDETIFFDEENEISLGFTEQCDIHIVTSSQNPMVGQFAYNTNQVKMLSGQNNNVTVYINGNGMALIGENGKIIASKSPFEKEQSIFADVDMDIIHNERLINEVSLFHEDEEYINIESLKMWTGDALLRKVRPNPFEPETAEELYQNCYEIFEIQSDALAKRLAHTHSKVSVVGISGGLDSTLALLVTAYAHKKLGKPSEDIIAITMPGFGTTGRTYENALDMMKSTGATVREISIVDAVTQHFKDIDHDMNDHSVTYENAQARERTQILMDIANKEGGIVVGTGDLSEEALGWCTFNGDHISMFGVNAGIPKTVIKFIVRWFIDVKLKEDVTFSKDNHLLAKTLEDILDTPISPELLPPDENGQIAQKTEDNVGPYELHDFFIFHTVRYGATPAKLRFLAEKAFEGKYDREFITKWLKVFYRRFFNQQFKRSCSPDSPQVGTIDLSPAHWDMPSDAFYHTWVDEL